MIDCSTVQAALRRVMEDPSASLPDVAALHLDECDRCRRFFDRGRVQLDPDVFEVLSSPERARMLRSIGAARSARPRRWLAVAATLALALLSVAAGIYWLESRRPVSGAAVASALVEDHIRYLDHPDRGGGPAAARSIEDLRSYVDFPVTIPELPRARLAGARRCYLLGRRVALAFYDAPRGPASYFTFAAEGLAPPGRRCPEERRFQCATSQGYHVVSWEEAGLVHAFVGPNASELLDMAEEARTVRAVHSG